MLGMNGAGIRVVIGAPCDCGAITRRSSWQAILVNSAFKGGDGFVFQMGGAVPRVLPWAMGRAVGVVKMKKRQQCERCP